MRTITLDGRNSPTIFLGFPITEMVANSIVAQLLYLDHEDPKQRIAMYINCPGGMVYHGGRLRLPR